MRTIIVNWIYGRLESYNQLNMGRKTKYETTMGCMKWSKGMALGPDFIASCTSQRPKAFERPIVNMLNIHFVISKS
jgi:hypothetical protein